ncbi:hypothetical protein [Arthrobacter oryzae]|uniref:hypothetical protein n=1 Tax=Arthrobacter oryzae TaxID=409290 RepID=UPI0030C9DA91
MGNADLLDEEPKIAISRDRRPASKDLQRELLDMADGTLRVLPLLAIIEGGSSRHVFAGSTAIFVQEGKVTDLRVWLDEEAESNAKGTLRECKPDDSQLALLKSQLKARITDFTDSASLSAENEECAAKVSKRLAEDSLDALSKLRELRYDLERELIDPPRGSTSGIVTSLTLLSIIIGKCTEQARRSVREGLWLWIPESDVYHAYRRHRDPQILRQVEASDFVFPEWTEHHDAATRHCQSLEEQLREESQYVRSLLTAASSISSASEADAQAKLNWIVAAVSIAVGVPGLIFSLYGANNLEELKEWSAGLWPYTALLPTSLAIAAWAMHKKHAPVWVLAVACTIMVVVVLLALWMAPLPPPEG